LIIGEENESNKKKRRAGMGGRGGGGGGGGGGGVMLRFRPYFDIRLNSDVRVVSSTRRPLFNPQRNFLVLTTVVLCYKSEGRWFDHRWCHSNFSLT